MIQALRSATAKWIFVFIIALMVLLLLAALVMGLVKVSDYLNWREAKMKLLREKSKLKGNSGG